MQTPGSSASALLAEGTVRHVSTINRELVLFMNGGRAVFDVPRDCEITLRGERIRFRMLQPRDRVRMSYTLVCGQHVARSIDVLVSP